MKKRAIGGLLAIIFISIVGCRDNAIETKELLQDLDYCVNTIREAHSEPFRKNSEQDFIHRKFHITSPHEFLDNPIMPHYYQSDFGSIVNSTT